MRSKLLTSAVVLTVAVGTSAAFGQSAGTTPSAGPPTQHSPTAPQSGTGSSSTQMDRSQPPDSNGSTPRQESTQSGNSARGSHQNAQDIPPDKQKSTEDRSKGDQTKSSESNGRKSDRMNAESRGNETDRDRQRSETRPQTTTGQAGASAKLSTQQRTKITNVIRERRVQPETNINFNISVGTRVPRSVHFHPLPAEIVTVYPDWRGYEFFLVRDEIIVVNPQTLEIVAVLEA